MFVLPTNNKAKVAAMSLMEKVSPLWNRFQQNLFLALEDVVGSLTAMHEKLIIVLDVACIEAFVRTFYGLPGRPPAERRALARAFVAKSSNTQAPPGPQGNRWLWIWYYLSGQFGDE